MKRKEINNPKTIIVKKERFFKMTISLKSIVYIILFFIFLFFTWFVLKNKWIIIKLNEIDNERVSLLYSILSSMTLLMFMLACGFEINYERIWLKILLIFIIILIVYYGYENVGIEIIFKRHYGLKKVGFYHHTYCSNDKNGILFFINNWLFWSIVYSVSLMFMTRD